jgi:hypothetical protein
VAIEVNDRVLGRHARRANEDECVPSVDLAGLQLPPFGHQTALETGEQAVLVLLI